MVQRLDERHHLFTTELFNVLAWVNIHFRTLTAALSALCYRNMRRALTPVSLLGTPTPYTHTHRAFHNALATGGLGVGMRARLSAAGNMRCLHVFAGSACYRLRGAYPGAAWAHRRVRGHRRYGETIRAAASTGSVRACGRVSGGQLAQASVILNW
jgi:IS5 family transposase